MADTVYETEIAIRYRDIDAMGHVNNAVYATYLEQARTEFIERVVEEPLLETGAVVSELSVDYLRPIDLGEVVTVSIAAEELGTTSIPLSYGIRADGEVAATAETIVVVYDREAGEPGPIPESWREAIETRRG